MNKNQEKDFNFPDSKKVSEISIKLVALLEDENLRTVDVLTSLMCITAITCLKCELTKPNMLTIFSNIWEMIDSRSDFSD